MCNLHTKLLVLSNKNLTDHHFVDSWWLKNIPSSCMLTSKLFARFSLSIVITISILEWKRLGILILYGEKVIFISSKSLLQTIYQTLNLLYSPSLYANFKLNRSQVSPRKNEYVLMNNILFVLNTVKVKNKTLGCFLLTGFGIENNFRSYFGLWLKSLEPIIW